MARPRWGQNFLVDQEVAAHIVAWARIGQQRVVEIGPGAGALTEALYAASSHLTLIEIDPVWADHWRRRYCDDPAVNVIEADFLRTDLGGVLSPDTHVVSNLPYESATPILRLLLEHELRVREMVVMVQREVAARLAAQPNQPGYGALSLFTQLSADVENGRIIEPTAFRPQPKVDSQLVRLRPLSSPRVDVGDPRLFRSLVRAAFATRRKMLRNGAGHWIDARLGAGQASVLFEELSIDGSLRPEVLPLEAFAALSRRVEAVGGAAKAGDA